MKILGHPKKEIGEAIILMGPNGSGKDTVEAELRRRQDGIERHVRYTTRIPALGEVDGEAYHFVAEDTFDRMIQSGDFIEYASYPGVMTGTSRSELHGQLSRAAFVTITLNYEDGIKLAGALRDASINTHNFFISPCSKEEFVSEHGEYREALRKRLEGRGRSTDHIEGRLYMAELYRTMYYLDSSLLTIKYVDNSNGNLDNAVEYIRRLL